MDLPPMIPPTHPLLSFVLLAGVVSAFESTSPVGIQPFPSVVQYAEARALPLGNFELAPPAEAARPGDRLIVLFAIEDGVNSRQWLGEFCAAALTAREARSKPGTGLGVLSILQSSLKTDTGHEYRFAQFPAALEIRIHGPFGNDQPSGQEPVATESRVLVTRDYLVHGLAPMAEIELRLRAAGKRYPDLSLLIGNWIFGEGMVWREGV